MLATYHGCLHIVNRQSGYLQRMALEFAFLAARFDVAYKYSSHQRASTSNDQRTLP